MLQNRVSPSNDAAQASFSLTPGLSASEHLSYPRRRASGTVLRSIPLTLFGAAVVAGIELFAPVGWKISDAAGAYLGNEKLVATEASYNALKAVAAAEADAKLHAQQTAEQFRAQNERLTHACQALYQQVGMNNQLIANMQQQYIAKRQELLSATMAADIARINMDKISPTYGIFLDILNGSNGAPAPRLTPEQVLDRYDRAMQEGMTKAMANIKRWQPGIGNMATIDAMVPADCITKPEVQPAVPPLTPPERYQRPPAKPGRG